MCYPCFFNQKRKTESFFWHYFWHNNLTTAVLELLILSHNLAQKMKFAQVSWNSRFFPEHFKEFFFTLASKQQSQEIKTNSICENHVKWKRFSCNLSGIERIKLSIFWAYFFEFEVINGFCYSTNTKQILLLNQIFHMHFCRIDASIPEMIVPLID